MIVVNKNNVNLIGGRDEVAFEFMCLCVCLLDNYNMMYTGHEEALIKEMLNSAIKVFKNNGYIRKEEKDGRQNSREEISH